MPSVSQLLAKPESKPIHLVEISSQDLLGGRLLCVSISKAAFVKQSNHPSGMLFDLPSQLLTIQDNFEKSFKFFVDGWQKVVGNIFFSDIGPFIKCVEMPDSDLGQHIGHIQYTDVDGTQFAYTWVFEVKADGIVPEVTATP